MSFPRWKERHETARFGLLLAEIRHSLSNKLFGKLPLPVDQVYRDGWVTRGYIRINGLISTKLLSGVPAPIFLGCILRRQRKTNEEEIAVVIPEIPDGVDRILGRPFKQLKHPLSGCGKVIHEVFNCYDRMECVVVDRSPMPTGTPVVPALVQVSRENNVKTLYIVGHGLGAVLATYLSFELSNSGQDLPPVQAYFIGSAKCGDEEFVQAFENRKINYTSYVFDADVIHHYPEGSYAQLLATQNMTQCDAQALIADNATAYHDVLCYSVMLNRRSFKRLLGWKNYFLRYGSNPDDLLKLKGGLLWKFCQQLGKFIWKNKQSLVDGFKNVVTPAAIGGTCIAAYIGSKTLINNYFPPSNTPTPEITQQYVSITSPIDGKVVTAPKDGTHIGINDVIATIGLPKSVTDLQQQAVKTISDIASKCIMDPSALSELVADTEEYVRDEKDLSDDWNQYRTAETRYTAYHADLPTALEKYDGIKSLKKRIELDAIKTRDGLTALQKAVAADGTCDHPQKIQTDFSVFTTALSGVFPVPVIPAIKGKIVQVYPINSDIEKGAPIALLLSDPPRS